MGYKRKGLSKTQHFEEFGKEEVRIRTKRENVQHECLIGKDNYLHFCLEV